MNVNSFLELAFQGEQSITDFYSHLSNNPKSFRTLNDFCICLSTFDLLSVRRRYDDANVKLKEAEIIIKVFRDENLRRGAYQSEQETIYNLMNEYLENVRSSRMFEIGVALDS